MLFGAKVSTTYAATISSNWQANLKEMIEMLQEIKKKKEKKEVSMFPSTGLETGQKCKGINLRKGIY